LPLPANAFQHPLVATGLTPSLSQERLFAHLTGNALQRPLNGPPDHSGKPVF